MDTSQATAAAQADTDPGTSLAPHLGAESGGESGGESGAVHGYTANKEAYLRRLKRIEGQVRGIARMVDEDKYCIDILTQVAAATKALHAVSLGLVEEHIGHCVIGAAAEPDAGLRAQAVDAKVKEAAEAIGRLLR